MFSFHTKTKKNFNLNVINHPIEKFLKNEFKFDTIIMSDVIEHLNNPFEILDLIILISKIS